MKQASLQQRIGMALRRRREREGYSQEGFADLIGMHRAYYGELERGTKDLQVSTLKRICDGLKVSSWEVLREAEED